MDDEYAFEGVVIRLKQKDYDKWLKNFKNIPNLDAVLMSRDVWLSEEADDKQRKKWFMSTVNYLVNVDARFKDKNKKDEQGRRLDEDGKHIFKRMP
jgi:hypothetical protein|tara:strand:+ start:374 stop:661 length:288 start_codon:yes stop_codon:yes gene_type:complete